MLYTTSKHMYLFYNKRAICLSICFHGGENSIFFINYKGKWHYFNSSIEFISNISVPNVTFFSVNEVTDFFSNLRPSDFVKIP